MAQIFHGSAKTTQAIRFQEDKGFGRDEALTNGNKGACEAVEHGANCKGRQLGRHSVDAK